jgi:hydroxymethylpyrimidine pyrophosphatase-like HAD family hydrolase
VKRTIVALDVDGTLYDGRRVDPAAVEAIEAAVAIGHVVVIVSGRPWRDLQRIIPDVLRSTSVAVCEHGAVLVDVASGAVRTLAEPVDPGVASIIAASDGRDMVLYEATIGLPASARDLAEDACAKVGGCYVVGNKGSIAIVPNGCDKGTGLRHAVDHLARSDPGMSAHRIMAIGDATNDLPMFAIADVAVAVANAEPALADTGVEITRNAFGAGVAEAISRHLLDGAQRTRTTPADSPPLTS